MEATRKSDYLAAHFTSDEDRTDSMKMRTVAVVAKLGLIALLAQGVSATAAEVKVIAGAALKGAFAELAPQFERRTPLAV